MLVQTFSALALSLTLASNAEPTDDGDEEQTRTGKIKTALLLRISLMAAYSYAAIHNARLIGAAP